MHTTTRTTRTQPYHFVHSVVSERRHPRQARIAAAVPSQRPGPAIEKYQLPSAVRHALLLPELSGSRARRVSEPEHQAPAQLPAHDRPHFAGDPSRRTETLFTSAVPDDELSDLRAAYHARKVNNLIYDPDFIAEQRHQSAKRPTVAIDLDKTLAVRSTMHEDRLFYDLHRNEDEQDEAWIVRPGFDEELAELVKDQVRLVLWTGGKDMRTWDFFQNRPDLLQLFDLIITQEDYFAYYLEKLAARTSLSGTPMDVLGVKVSDLIYKMRAYHHSFSPKWASVLGFHVIVDDHDGLKKISADNPFGPFETVPVKPFAHERPIPRSSILYDEYRRGTHTIVNDIRAALRRKGFSIP